MTPTGSSSLERVKTQAANAAKQVGQMDKNALKKRRTLFAIAVFVCLVGRVAKLHYDRNQLWSKILKQYDSDTSNDRLIAKDLVSFLRDSGVNVTKEQLKMWVGKVDDEKDGYDQSELMKVVDFFDDMDSWKGDKTGSLASISETHLPGMSASADVVFLLVIGGLLAYFVVNSEAMEKRVAANSFVSAIKVSSMKNKWKKLEGDIQVYSDEKSELDKKLEKLEADHKEALALANKNKDDGEAKFALEASNKSLEETKRELEMISSKQVHAESELNRLRMDTEKHISQAHMNNTKLQAMRGMLKGIDAVGAANPFKGASKGEFSGDGAKAGFAMKGRTGSSLLKGTQQVTTGFRMDSFVFGYPTEDDIVFYEVNRKKDLLGEGADCAYKCRDIATKEQFAVKIYEIRGTAQKRQIVNDLKAKQSFDNHPHIVRYHAVVETEEQIFVLMELIPGKDLFGHVVDCGGLTEPQSRTIFVQLCEALLFCHSQGIIHGDVKPENAMVINPDSKEPTVKLIDFGFACFLDSEHAVDNKAVGDVYSPPEALEGKPSSKEIDSFRLGCTLYVMLMATYPFQRHCRDLKERREGNVLKYPKWKELSSEAQDLIERLCRDRLPIDQALEHPWLKTGGK